MPNIFTNRTDDTDSKSSAKFCVLDAMHHNEVNGPKYSAEQKNFSQELYTKISEAYTRSRVYRTFRKGFIAIKVEHPQKADRITKEVAAIDSFCETNGIVIASSGKNLIYRIPA